MLIGNSGYSGNKEPRARAIYQCRQEESTRELTASSLLLSLICWWTTISLLFLTGVHFNKAQPCCLRKQNDTRDSTSPFRLDTQPYSFRILSAKHPRPVHTQARSSMTRVMPRLKRSTSRSQTTYESSDCTAPLFCIDLTPCRPL